MKLSVATSNPGKLREFAFEGLDVVQIPPVDAPDEDGETFEENAAIKAIEYSRRFEGLVTADDSGLMVDALGGAPGVHSARWAGDDAANNRKLVESMRGQTNRAARYVCVIAVAESGRLLASFRGEVEGVIVDQPRGQGGFGYDPYFFYPPMGKTMAEMTPAEKRQISHRHRALEQLAAWIENRA
jgi:XTP/dITP diphosphohydrolase